MAHNEYLEPRGRNFAFVQLIENLPEDWEEIVKEKLLPMAYIVHDKDEYTKRDEEKNPEHKHMTPKKPHVHFFVYFSGKKTVSGVLQMFSEFNIGYVEKIESKNAYLAYMLHLRQEDKYQYPYDALKVVNGLKVNYADLSDVTFADVLEYIHEYSITRFGELVRVLKDTDPPMFRYVTGHYALVCAYFSDERESMGS